MTEKPSYEELAKKVQELEKAELERKEVEEKLRESEERFRQVVENIREVFWLRDRHTGRILYISPAYETIWGRTVEEMYRKGPSFMENVHPEDKERVSVSHKAMYEEDRPFDEEYRMMRPDRSIRWVRARCYPVFNQNGEVTRYACVAEDITERKMAEERIRSQHRFLQLLIDSIPITVFYKDTQGIYIGCNDAYAAFLGKPKNEIIGKGVYDVFPKDLADKYHAMDQNLFKHPGIQQYEAQMDHSDGTRHDVLFNKATYADESGKVVGLIGAMLDIAERKNMEKRLNQAHKMEAIGTLAGGIAHDFNNILSAVLGYTELALDDVEKGTPLEDNLQEVYKGGIRAGDLVKQILTFARQTDEEAKPVRVSSIAKEALKLIRSSTPTFIEVRSNINSNSLVMADPSKIHQIFMNLCTNACQAMEEKGGVLQVDITDVRLGSDFTDKHLDMVPGDYLKLTITDTGQGIEPGILDRIFEPYFTTKGPGEGTGMGLSLVHSIVRSYGGAVAVESKAGKGSVFTVYLPVTKKRTEERPLTVEKLPVGTERVLLVDDELPIVQMNSRALERLGYQVTSRTSSIEALEFFKVMHIDFDIVITDMTMPNMTGDELAAELIKIRPDIPIILCTGFSKRISEEKAAEIGIKAFAMKPLSAAELAKTVRKVLDEARG